MMATQPAVTVIIPTYNWSTVLPFSIGSVLRQTFADFELLVVGDGCTDDSEAVVGRINDPRVRWINLHANSGHQSAPNNEGLRQARGELIAYLGHDDLWLPHHLASLRAGIAAGCDLAYGVIEIVGPEGSYVGPGFPLTTYKPTMWIPPTSMMHRRTVTEHVGGWRDHRELEWDPEVELWHRASLAGHKFAFVTRLTGVKFPASLRPNVYKLRPHHEQEAWSKRIQNEPAFEITELVRMLAAAQFEVWKLRHGGDALNAKPMDRGAQVAARRKLKGLDP
jgi:glycosyltransferase involved in cell wall biosynthesis